MLKRIFLIFALSLIALPALADRQTVREYYVNELREDGYREIKITRTLLGRMRFVATNAKSRREIVVNPNTGVVLRDYVKFFGHKDDEEAGSSGHEEEDDDDKDDDDDDDDDEDNSGSGSSDSGSGSDDDDDDDDEDD